MCQDAVLFVWILGFWVCFLFFVLVVHTPYKQECTISSYLSYVSWHILQAAGVCRPLISTVIARNEDQKLVESLDRTRYVASEMPQGFQTSVISAAYDKVEHFFFTLHKQRVCAFMCVLTHMEVQECAQECVL